MILASVRNSFFARDSSLIARDYTVRGGTARPESQVCEDAKFNESMGLRLVLPLHAFGFLSAEIATGQETKGRTFPVNARRSSPSPAGSRLARCNPYVVASGHPQSWQKGRPCRTYPP